MNIYSLFANVSVSAMLGDMKVNCGDKPGEVTDLFLVRDSSDIIYYLDINSPGLRDILRAILKVIRTADLGTEKPSV